MTNIATTIPQPLPQAQPQRLNRRQRRAAKALGRDQSVFTAPVFRDCEEFSAPAFHRLERMMARFGNRLSQEHREALFCIVHDLTRMANGGLKGRHVYDLDCGCGKTQSVIAWLATLAHSDKPWSVAVCSTRVEDLCDIKQQLMEHHDVPEHLIGLKHSYKHDKAKAEAERSGYAALPATDDNDQRPILLVTHNRVRGSNGDVAIDEYRGQKRSLVIWDKSLIVSSHLAVDCMTIKQGVYWLKPAVEALEPEEPLRAAHDYLSEVWGRLEQDMDRQRTGAEPSQIAAVPLHPDTLEAHIKALPHDMPKRKAMISFLKMTQEPLRVVAETSQGGGGFVQYHVAVPSDLDTVAVLDASYNIRKLEHMDASMKRSGPWQRVQRFKRYDDVTVHWLNAVSGRGSVTQDFMSRRETRKIAKEVVEVVQDIPEDEAVIINTFLAKDARDKAGNVHRRFDTRQILKDDLYLVGIDTKAVLANGKPRFVWLTHGNGTAVSKHSYCSNIIFVGVLHRSAADIAGAIVGQRNDLLAQVSGKDIKNVERSEIAYNLHQAMLRGSARITEGNKAMPMKVWLMHYDTSVKGELEKVMPGICWTDWEPKHLQVVTRKVSDAADKIVAALQELDPEVAKVSTKKLRALAGLEDMPKMTFVRAIEEAGGQLPDWRKEGRSLVRHG